MVVLGVSTRKSIVRLAQTPWLRRAVAGGWVGWVTVSWCNSAMTRALASWKGPAREVPLSVSLIPPVSDEDLAECLGLPRLWGLELPTLALRNPSVLRVGERADLRNLWLAVWNVEPGVASAMLDQIGRLVGLRGLILEGRIFPDDGDLGSLGGLVNLRTLALIHCSPLTNAALEWVRGLPGLRQLTLMGCKGITPEGVELLQRDRPSLAIKVL